MNNAAQQSTGPDEHVGVSVVIPCLNEEQSIARVVTDAREALTAMQIPFEVIVSDNGSTDRSIECAKEAGAVIVRECRKGYGSAIRKGFEESRYSILVMADGDTTYDLSRIQDILQPVLDGRADFVLGNRLQGVKPKAMPFLHQHLGNPLLTKMVQLMWHRKDIEDAHSGYRAITKSAYRALDCITTGMEFASEMIIKAIYKNLRIQFVDIEYHPREGESKLRTFRDGWRHLRFMMMHSPSTVFVIPGITLWIISLVLILPLALGPVMIASRRIDIHFMLIMGVLNIVSMQFMSVGMLAKAFAHLTGIRHDPVVAWLYEKLSFEVGALLAGSLLLIGVLLCMYVVIIWFVRGFGDLDMARPLLFGLLCFVNGTQLGVCSYLFSIMALPRRMNH